MSIKLNSALGGSVTLNEPATASAFTLTLPTDNIQPGMNLITPTSVVGGTFNGGAISFSAASSISINGCFSSLYDNYRIYMGGVCSVFSVLDSRLRLSGSDSAVNYGGQTLRASGATVSAASGATTAATIGAIHTTQSIITIDLVGPSKTEQTAIYGVCGLGSAPRIDHCASFHTNATAYDGITFLPDIGTSGRTLTGTLRIYGMRNQ